MSLDNILIFWFPSDDYQAFWFDGQHDQYIKDTYKELVLVLPTEDTELKTKNDLDRKLALIILYDQFTRNVFRGTLDAKRNDNKALKLAYEILDSKEDYKLKLTRRFFVLLPLRHQKTTKAINIVLDRIEQYEKEFPGHKDLHKFRLATYKDCSNLNDNITVDNNDDKSQDTKYDAKNYTHILDPDCFQQQPITKQNPIAETVSKFLIDNKITSLVVSLSGGVDSMVLLTICKKLSDNGQLHTVIAVHVDYNNREESSQEADFLQLWCQINKIVLIKRKIDYIKRDTVDRDFYETETKIVRFNLYKFAQEKYSTQCVLLGHHKDDLSENVLTNIMKGNSASDLLVMHPMSMIHNIVICRPLLQHVKKDIFDFAHGYSIPYFKNTTPSWSVRGRIREKLLPLLENIYGKTVLTCLYDAGKECHETDTYIRTTVINPFLETVSTGPLGCFFGLKSVLNIPASLWRQILLKLFHSKMNTSMITGKNMKLFMEYLADIKASNYNSNNKMLKFQNGFYCLADSDQVMYFINIQKLKSYNDVKKPTTIDLSTTTRLNYDGSWTIEFKLVNAENKIRDQVTMKDIIRGKYMYTEAFVKNTLQLVTSFSKQDKTRKIFSKIPLQLRSFIPMITSGHIVLDGTEKYVLINIENATISQPIK